VAQSLDDAPRETTPADIGVPLAWRKSTRSIANGQCIEAATLAAGRPVVRDSMDKDGPIVKFSESQWRNLIQNIKSGYFSTK
jgi:Domain of unknown function (DUF397)